MKTSGRVYGSIRIGSKPKLLFHPLYPFLFPSPFCSFSMHFAKIYMYMHRDNPRFFFRDPLHLQFFFMWLGTSCVLSNRTAHGIPQMKDHQIPLKFLPLSILSSLLSSLYSLSSIVNTTHRYMHADLRHHHPHAIPPTILSHLLVFLNFSSLRVTSTINNCSPRCAHRSSSLDKNTTIKVGEKKKDFKVPVESQSWVFEIKLKNLFLKLLKTRFNKRGLWSLSRVSERWYTPSFLRLLWYIKRNEIDSNKFRNDSIIGKL